MVQTTLSALFRSTNTGVVVRGFRSSSVPVTYEGYLVESRRPLWPSSGPHKLIALSLIHCAGTSRWRPCHTARQ